MNAIQKYRYDRWLKYAELAADDLAEDEFYVPAPPVTHPDFWDYALCNYVEGKPITTVKIGSKDWVKFMKQKDVSDEYKESIFHYLELDGKQEFFYEAKEYVEAESLLYRDGITPGKFMITKNVKKERKDNMICFTIMYTLLFLDANGHVKTRNIAYGKIKNRRRYFINGLKTWHVSLTSLVRHLIEQKIMFEGTPLTHTFRKLKW